MKHFTIRLLFFFFFLIILLYLQFIFLRIIIKYEKQKLFQTIRSVEILSFPILSIMKYSSDLKSEVELEILLKFLNNLSSREKHLDKSFGVLSS